MHKFLCSYQLFSVIGLCFDMAGVLILFYTGLPIKLPKRELYIEEKIHPDQVLKDKRQKRLAYIGLILLFMGFAFQLTSTILSL